MQSGSTTPAQRQRGTTSRPISDNENDNENENEDENEDDGFTIKKVKNIIDITTTSPLLIVNKSPSSNTVTPKVIDGDVLLSNFDVNNLTDEERREMLTNILGVIQSRTLNNNVPDTKSLISPAKKFLTTKTSKRSSSPANVKKDKEKRKNSNKSTRLLPVTKANNVRIISSLDELNKEPPVNNSNEKSNQPIYVVLLPQNKKKK